VERSGWRVRAKKDASMKAARQKVVGTRWPSGSDVDRSSLRGKGREGRQIGRRGARGRGVCWGRTGVPAPALERKGPKAGIRASHDAQIPGKVERRKGENFVGGGGEESDPCVFCPH